MYLLFCAELPAPCCSHQDAAVQESAGSCAQLAEMYGITEQGADSAEHGAVDDGDAVRKQQAI
jgi:hypothetical protein